MSGTFPQNPVAGSIKISSIRPTMVSTTHSLKRQVRSRGSQLWSIEANYNPLSRSDFAPLYAFALAQQGQYETFTYYPPVYKDAQGTCSGCTSAVEAAGATSVTVTMTGTLKAGDYVKFASHSKVYIVTADLSGNGELSIDPPLLQATTAAAVTYNEVPFNVAFAGDTQEFSRGAADLHEFSIKLIEVI